MGEQDPLWQLLKQAPPPQLGGSLAPRTLSRLAVEKGRRRRWAQLEWGFGVFLFLIFGGGSCVFWVSERRSGQEAGLARAAFSSIESHREVEDVGWLQGQLLPEHAENGEAEIGETVLWEEESSF
ncbi:hypothetical protein [Verrucomicrobium sp. 3C]|uniref:hypothetical protein n=1 Tax=Verrucomicrobium sp. 3C TaxID=1134055 RepID=UPI0012E00CB3|nr:hypothetical protein [Verrucomicrobium sp. 3C]